METAGTSNLYWVGTWLYDSLDVKTEVVDLQGKTSRWGYSVDNMKQKNYSLKEMYHHFQQNIIRVIHMHTRNMVYFDNTNIGREFIMHFYCLYNA